MEKIDLKKIKEWRNNSFKELEELEKILPTKDIALLKKCVKEGQKFANETILQRLIYANQEFKRGNTENAVRSIKELQANYFIRFAMEKQKEITKAKGHSKYPLQKEHAELMQNYYNHLPEERKKPPQHEPGKKLGQRSLESFEIEIKGTPKKIKPKTRRRK